MLRGKRERERGGLAEFLYKRDCDHSTKKGQQSISPDFPFSQLLLLSSFNLLDYFVSAILGKKPKRFPCFSKKLFVGFTVRKYTPLVEHVIQLLHGVVFELYILPFRY
jgi:hypothetical protein